MSLWELHDFLEKPFIGLHLPVKLSDKLWLMEIMESCSFLIHSSPNKKYELYERICGIKQKEKHGKNSAPNVTAIVKVF